MLHTTASSSPDACPAAAVIMATRLAKTPLAIADARTPGAPILFANEAFATLVGRDATAADITLAAVDRATPAAGEERAS
jgi:hypothetical protein